MTDDEPVWCGACKNGKHEKCAGFRGAVRAMHHGGARGEENCCCSCDTTQPKVPGQRYAREWNEEEFGCPD